MANTFSDGSNREFLDELLFKCDIVNIISEYIPLTRKGGKYFGCCPFHNEKTGSFCVNQAEQYYYCFGCHAGGNIINFVMEMEALGFWDAVKFLADKVGLEVPEIHADPNKDKKKEKREILLALMKDAAHYYRNNLLKDDGKEAREYLASRRIDDDTARRYGIGLSLGRDQLQGFLRRKGYSVENLRECGLVQGENLVDAFAGRIIVPIMDGMGNVVAFGGRIYHGEKDVAKYKNSTNTLLFDKSRMMYGVNFVKKEKKVGSGFKELILVEGYMDVISLGAAGIKNAVAGMGTALTMGQASILKRLVSTVYVCYDGDGAGQHAAMQNTPLLESVGLEVKVVCLDDGMDPDDAIKAEGYAGFMKRVKEALSLTEYRLMLAKKRYNLDTLDGRSKYARDAIAILNGIANVAERAVYLGEVSSLSGVSVQTLSEMIREFTPQKEERRVEIKPSLDVSASRYVLGRLIEKADYADVKNVKKEWFALPTHQKIVEELQASGGKITTATLYDVIDDKIEVDAIVGVQADEFVRSQDGGQKYYDDCLCSLADAYIQSRIDALNVDYALMADPREKRETVLEIQTLIARKKSKQISDKF